MIIVPADPTLVPMLSAYFAPTDFPPISPPSSSAVTAAQNSNRLRDRARRASCLHWRAILHAFTSPCWSRNASTVAATSRCHKFTLEAAEGRPEPRLCIFEFPPLRAETLMAGILAQETSVYDLVELLTPAIVETT
jgi:hypothetical protein